MSSVSGEKEQRSVLKSSKVHFAYSAIRKKARNWNKKWKPRPIKYRVDQGESEMVIINNLATMEKA